MTGRRLSRFEELWLACRRAAATRLDPALDVHAREQLTFAGAILGADAAALAVQIAPIDFRKFLVRRNGWPSWDALHAACLGYQQAARR